MSAVLVYCGSSRAAEERHGAVARSLAALLVARGHSLVYGGGRTGLMGIIADGVLAGGGKVIGYIPRAMVSREVAHHDITELHVVRDMHERKAAMMNAAELIIALPGGIGTLEEWAEAITWFTLGYHAKPVGLLNAGGFYDPLIAQIERMQDEGFLHAQVREKIIVENDPATLLARLGG
ncbi:MAG TPA: TIGR00730 family Rossman fold protein [Kiritimatiellia bacterium]|nr:TIGR00730 family Rossman fold protein [Kiritimatiellia bacterium]HMP34104.1 TIGR00730 family Rossman fold protein [Kiritimatiellia bacterium]